MQRGLHGDETDTHARWMEANVRGPSGRMIRVVSIYLPNGNPIGTEKFTYKLAWMARFRGPRARTAGRGNAARARRRLQRHPDPVDCKRPEAWVNDALFQPQTRNAYHALLGLGLTDAVRTGHTEPGSIPSGTIRPARSRRTTASGSTTSCSHRRPPIC